jgi:XTP/dITP diphosphohydrolase
MTASLPRNNNYFFMAMNDKLKAFERLLIIMDELREQCPWDKKQSIESLRTLTIEETYELCDAILQKDMQQIKGELGDLFLHLVFYAKIASESNAFDVADVLNGVCDKLVHRHPHVYGDVKVVDEEDVKRNWEQLKLKEGKKSVLEGVPHSLPALVKAIRMQDKARGVGFDWDNKTQVWEKVQEEIQEFQLEEARNDLEKMEDEFGDVLFSLVNYARFVGINPEDALEKTNRKFLSRFQFLEKESEQQGKSLQDMTLPEMEAIWQKAKGRA